MTNIQFICLKIEKLILIKNKKQKTPEQLEKEAIKAFDNIMKKEQENEVRENVKKERNKKTG